MTRFFPALYATFALFLSAFAQTQQPPSAPPRDPAEGQQQASPTKTAAPTAAPAAPATLDTKPLRWRSIGPANMGGRISDFAVVEKDPYTIFVSTGTGGAFRTTNNGTTWEPIFDKQPVASTNAIT